MPAKLTCLVAAIAASAASGVSGFYLPGVAPREYFRGEQVALKVNKLTSLKTQLPYEYYRLPFCEPDVVVNKAENLGEILTGNVIENSPYDVRFLEEDNCHVLCRKTYKKADVDNFLDKIKEEYVVNWIVDNLPVAGRIPMANSDNTANTGHGFPLGGMIVLKDKSVSHFLNNHASIVISYHSLNDGEAADSPSGRIVGLTVEPFSVNHKFEGDSKTPATCNSRIKHEYHGGYPQLIDQPTEVVWTYDVSFEPSAVRWASRWDLYLNNKRFDDDVHWFSIVNSMLIVVFLTGMVAMIMMRTLHRDLNRYNSVPTEEEKAEDREETGWKLVHGDVSALLLTRGCSP
jgi:transmembrane 9 superfamily protein 2/4